MLHVLLWLINWQILCRWRQRWRWLQFNRHDSQFRMHFDAREHIILCTAARCFVTFVTQSTRVTISPGSIVELKCPEQLHESFAIY